MSSVKTVLFDIGNVLSHDGHDTYLLHKKYGMALEFGITKEEMAIKTSPVFKRYAVVANASESEFWKDICSSLGIEISSETIEKTRKQINYINSESQQAFEFLQGKSVPIGVISNSTPIFYPDMAANLNLDKYISKNLSFLSHIEGRIKSDGLFEIAASRLQPSTTLIIEDRKNNIAYANKLGFQTTYYSLESGESLLDLVKGYFAEPKSAIIAS